ncbi:nucleotidyltransferase domain-containing protein [uncultured Amnibacterium sp.]|uniref:nucleotidyltransferase domain-containing protein n=1 Tax=uncultured Amnibacterium sp. TaxID=1631851 RepID=UPI0035C98434
MGRSYVWSLNRDHLAAEALIALANMRQTLLDHLTEEAHTVPGLMFAALFGSAARGNMRLDSDIDLFLVSADDAAQSEFASAVSALEWKVSRWTGNDARALTMRESEIDGGAPVLQQIANEGITLTSDPLWLHRRMMRRTREQARSI